jgi:hypothetical protein
MVIAYKRHCTARYARGCVSPYLGGLVVSRARACACREASARALQDFVPCCEGDAAPSCVLPDGRWAPFQRPFGPLLVSPHAHTGVEPYPSRLAAPPVCPRLQDVQGNPSATRCQRCVRPRPCATLPLSSSLARLLPIEDTAQPDTPAAVSRPRRVSPCGAKGSCGVPGRKRPHEPCNTPYLANSLPAPRASSA